MLDIGRDNVGVEAKSFLGNTVSGGGPVELQGLDAELMFEVNASLSKAGLAMPDDKIAEVIAKARIFEDALRGRTTR